MRLRGLLLAGILAVTGAGAGAQGGGSAPAAGGFATSEASDPFTWLEEIRGERALAWAISTLPTWVSSMRSKYTSSPEMSTMAIAIVH